MPKKKQKPQAVTIETVFVTDKDGRMLIRNQQNVLEIRESPGTPGLFPKVGLRLTQHEIRRDYNGHMIIRVSKSHYADWNGEIKEFPK